MGPEVDDEICKRLAGELLLLAAEDPRRDLTLYINSPGGKPAQMIARHTGQPLERIQAGSDRDRWFTAQ